MPEDKKNQQKGKSNAKEQRKSRQGRQKSGPTKIPDPSSIENKTEAPKAQEPLYEDPRPELYKNLKRETDEILKITEEANSKYKKKEIQSNWSKYEIPVESYDDIQEQENMGADYEKLIQMPMSVGGHFQFKHEKSWDIGTGPSIYDKYFEINMNDLATALCTIPFYERNDIDRDIFSETDILTMDSRAVKYKQKYYNDKSYTTPELEARDKISNSLKDSFSKTQPGDIVCKNLDSAEKNNDDTADETPAALSVKDNDEIDFKLENNKNVIDTDINNDMQAVCQSQKVVDVMNEIEDLILEHSNSLVQDETPAPKAQNNIIRNDKLIVKETCDKAMPSKPEESKNPVIESPEDLEKWLDDFLDG
ncbi:uncharacterized protein Aven isoform X2 [Plodia interpunctella]|uniref:uncharacterized protein Aven isoform X2 n=1 Tax=Plodia interpunctella TaxID=58824 RepID=UPI002367CBB1|nr:uncharacterized protein LOC128674228 isoform X2 [Plodia interpunctella]